MIQQLTKGWKNVVDVEPGFYKGVDRYEQACQTKLTIKLMNDKVII